MANRWWDTNSEFKPLHDINPLRLNYIDSRVPVAGKSVLDIGCGNGEYLLRLKSIGWQCQGVEFNETALAICRKQGLEVFHGDLKAANFAAESFDFVTAHHLIEHTADPAELVREMARVTKPGGTILIRTPNSKALGRRWFGVNWFDNDVPRHLMLFCPASLAIIAEQHGLQLLKLRKPVKPKLVLKSLDYKLGNTGVPSKKRKLRKWLAKLYVPLAMLGVRLYGIAGIFAAYAVANILSGLLGYAWARRKAHRLCDLAARQGAG